jgi:rSAM/selenodomain-associated transferase 1
MRRARVAVFARAPEPGKVKTRLARDVGDARACALYRWLGARVVASLTADGSRPYDVAVRVTPSGACDAVRAWVPGADAYEPQGEGDLGERLARATSEGFEAGYGAVVLVGTDCLAVTDGRVREALRALEGHDAALGPARDGGYYLLALGRSLPVFEGVPWSTARVAEVTRGRVRDAGASLAELAVETDIDTVDDLDALRGHPDAPGWAAG